MIEPPPLAPASCFPPAPLPTWPATPPSPLALAEVVAGPLPDEVVSAALAATALPGRAEQIPGEPPLLVDAAHNEQGARALAEALPAFAAGRRVYACLSILADKDAEAIVAALAPALTGAICTAADPGPAMGRPGAKARDPQELAALLTRAGVETEVDRGPRRGRSIVCSSLRERIRRGGLRRIALPSAVRMDREARSELLSMMGLVAAVVAIVILVFFGLGYLFGRLFL